MPRQGQATWLLYNAWNTSSNAYQTGDSGNQTIKLLKDSIEASATNAPFEIDSTGRPGLYAVAATSAETLFNLVNIGGISSTGNVVLIDRTYSFTATSTAQIGVQVVSYSPGQDPGSLVLQTPANKLATVSSGLVLADVRSWNAAPLTTIATISGVPAVNLIDITGIAVNSGAAQLGVSVINIAGQPAQLDVNNLLQIDVQDIGGAVINTAAAQLGVNVVQIGGVVALGSLAQGSVNAAQIAGTGTVSSLALGNVNVVTIGGVGLVTSSAIFGVNVVTIGGTLAQTSLASGGVNVNKWLGGSPSALSGGNVQADVETWRTVTVNTLISGRVDSNVGQMQIGAIATGNFVAGTLTTTVFGAPYLTSALIDTTFVNTVADGLGNRSNAIETGVTPYQAWRYTASSTAAVLSGAGTGTVQIQAIGNPSTNRITASTDNSGNRTVVTLS